MFRDESGKIVSLVTQGDANNTTDGAIELENVVGKCVGSVGGLGDFAMFMNTPVGILVFVGIPVLLYIAYDVTHIMIINKRAKSSNSAELQEKMAEIERLRALVEKQGVQESAEQQDARQSTQTPQSESETIADKKEE